MADLIENPVINSPFEEPRRHFRFDDKRISDEIVPRHDGNHGMLISDDRAVPLTAMRARV